MLELRSQTRQAIDDLCTRHGVRRLELFGSAATDEYVTGTSDVDMIVEFEPEIDLGPWLKDYFVFRERLEDLLGRPVDLVMAGAIHDRYFIQQSNHTRSTLYAAEDAEVAG